MKRYLLYSMLGAASLFTAACHEDFNADVAAPQQWEQEEAIALPGFSVQGTTELKLAEANDSVAVFTPSIDVTQLPTGAVVDQYRIQLTADKENATPVILEASKDGKVLTSALQAQIEKDFGKRPELRKYNAVVYADVMQGTQASLLEAKTEVTAIPVAPFIDKAYYLIGDMCGWDAAKILPFNHSDKDVYDDPEFTIMFSTTAENNHWKIITQTNKDAGNVWIEGPTGVVGVEKNGDPSMEGKLITTKPQAGKLEKQGLYKMTINMMDYTFKIEEIAPEYYLVGALQGWNNNPASGMKSILYPKDVMNQSYTTKWTGDANLKIWMGKEFGDWSKAIGTEKDADQSPSGTLGGGGAIKCPEPNAFYTFAVDFGKNTYTWTKLDNQTPKEYKTVGLIGNFNGWGGDEAMAQVTPHNWYLQGLTVKESGEIKFRADNDWKDDWGGGFDLNDTNSGTLVYKGGNMKIAAGTYNVFMNDITGEFVFKKL